jgi:predicted CXXCH cytochrome family protein
MIVVSLRIFLKRTVVLSGTFLLTLPLILFIPGNSSAKATGVCSNCHTMHNSQGGIEMATDRTPHGTLLLDTCVGCHSSSESSTTYDLDGCKVPVVYFTGSPPGTYLAGGNYYWVKNTGDAYGHNPVELGAVDSTLTSPPGGPGPDHTFQVRCSGGGGAGAGSRGCHGNRFLENDATMKGFHHQNEGETLTTANTVGNSFRGIFGLKGYEDPDWEQETTTDHNRYSGSASPSTSNCAGSCHGYAFGWPSGSPPEYDTISGFCAACHGQFHQLDDAYSIDGFGGTQSNGQWIRHPSDILLPETGEYGGYPTYSVEAPVGYTDVSAPTRATAVVTCLSCHRAHGSPYPDMLRWDYNDMVAGGGTNTTGCFTCHTTKDDGS